MSARCSAASNVNEHPIRKLTRSSRHRFSIDVGSSTRFPSRQTRYRGRSVRKSAVGAEEGCQEPDSVTVISGQGFGFLWQKSRKSKAQSRGRITRFACANPGANPAVGPVQVPDRHARRTSFPVENPLVCCKI